jgi:hypothetical protein
MMSNEDIHSKIKQNISKLEEVKKNSAFDGLPIVAIFGKGESFLELLKTNQSNLLNKECKPKEVEELVLNILNFKQNVLKQCNKRLLQMEYRKETLSQIYDVLLKQNKLMNLKEYENVFNKYKETLDVLFVSEDLTSLDMSKTKETLNSLKEEILDLKINSPEQEFKEVFNSLGFLINSFSQDIMFLKEKIEELPFLIDESESSILVSLKNLQKNLGSTESQLS